MRQPEFSEAENKLGILPANSKEQRTSCEKKNRRSHGGSFHFFEVQSKRNTKVQEASVPRFFESGPGAIHLAEAKRPRSSRSFCKWLYQDDAVTLILSDLAAALCGL